jgi:hypothetical protein
MNSLKIQWNHLVYKDTFCCSGSIYITTYQNPTSTTKVFLKSNPYYGHQMYIVDPITKEGSQVKPWKK